MTTLRDLLTLTKPRVTALVLASAASGMVLAPGRLPLSRVVAALVGTTLIVAAANTLNMWRERDLDALMVRTARRPLPEGRMQPGVALGFGLVLAALSLALLAMVNLLTVALGLFALVNYVVLYTPLKRHGTVALLVGAVSGAMPPLMGWTSVTGSIAPADADALTALPLPVQLGGVGLFALVFLWQVPHFLAVSLVRAEDYARAGMKVVPNDRGERAAKWQIVGYSLLLLGASLAVCRLASAVYFAAACAFGALFVSLCAYGLRARSSVAWARLVFACSIVYLVAIFAVLIVDRASVWP